MFKAYYGFAKNPFDKQHLSEADRFPSKDYQEMLSRLTYLKDVRGIGVFTSNPGFGKTYALRCFVKGLDRNLYQMHYLCLSTVSVLEFYRQLCLELGLDLSNSKTKMFKAFRDRVHHLLREKKRPLILAIDEAHELDAGILTDLKMIMNFEYDHTHGFTLVLIGEPHLNRILEKPIHEALRQRITVHYDFEGMDSDEVKRYIIHKLRLAGAADTIVGEDAIHAIVGGCHGNPRLIDRMMTEALTLGA